MSVWRYSAVALAGTNQGDVRTGEVSGESAAAARAALREIGLQVLVLRPMAAQTGSQRSTRGWWNTHLRTRRRLVRAHLYDGLATLLESGLPLLEALDTTIKSLPRRRSPLRQALVQVREGVRSGELFGQARLEAVLADVGDMDLQEIKGAVLKRLRAHAGGDLRHDDVTLLAIELR